MKGLICLSVLSLVAVSIATEQMDSQGKFAPFPYKPIYRHAADPKRQALAVPRGRFLPESFRPGGRPMGMSQWSDMGFGNGDQADMQDGNAFWVRK